MATTMNAYRSVLDSVVTTAAATSTLLGTAGKSINMLSNFVDEASEVQQASHKINKARKLRQVTADAIMADLAMSDEIADYIGDDEKKRERYSEAQTHYDSIAKTIREEWGLTEEDHRPLFNTEKGKG